VARGDGAALQRVPARSVRRVNHAVDHAVDHLDDASTTTTASTATTIAVTRNLIVTPAIRSGLIRPTRPTIRSRLRITRGLILA